VDQALATKGYHPLFDALGTDSFWRVKVGIGHPFSKEEVINYVLGEPQKNEKEVLIRAADYIADQLSLLITERNFSTGLPVMPWTSMDWEKALLRTSLTWG